MKAVILPLDAHVRIDDEPVQLTPDQIPAGPELPPDTRAIRAIHFDGVAGVIERKSRVPGRVDIEHFLGAEPLAPYIAAHGKAIEAREAQRAADHAEQLAALQLAGQQEALAAEQAAADNPRNKPNPPPGSVNPDNSVA